MRFEVGIGARLIIRNDAGLVFAGVTETVSASTTSDLQDVIVIGISLSCLGLLGECCSNFRLERLLRSVGRMLYPNTMSMEFQ